GRERAWRQGSGRSGKVFRAGRQRNRHETDRGIERDICHDFLILLLAASLYSSGLSDNGAVDRLADMRDHQSLSRPFHRQSCPASDKSRFRQLGRLKLLRPSSTRRMSVLYGPVTSPKSAAWWTRSATFALQISFLL